MISSSERAERAHQKHNRTLRNILSRYNCVNYESFVHYINRRKRLSESNRLDRETNSWWLKARRLKRKIDTYIPLEDVEQCQNCFRVAPHYRSPAPEHGAYQMILIPVSSQEISSGARQYKNCSHSVKEGIEYTLCLQCKHHLCDKKKFNDMKHTWPAFIWSMLSSRAVMSIYRATVWRFVPMPWRHWWIDHLQHSFPTVYGTITLSTPAPAFKDCTIEMHAFHRGIDFSSDDKKSMANLRDASNRYLMPLITCPYGCTEYLHKCQQFPLDAIFQRYLPSVRLNLSTDSKRLFMDTIGMRDDYIRDVGDEDMWLLNKEWTIFPSISFDKDLTPCILSCRHHKKITRKYMVHTCRRPNHILPAAMPDQLCHVCIKPRTVQQMKRNFGSHGFQMYRQDGSFNGIDTCSCTSHGNFDFCSYISGEDEARAIVNRPDINSLLTTLAEKNVISTFTAECRRRDALDTTRGIDFSKYTRGATYVPLDICIHFHRESSIPRTIKTVNDSNDERNNEIVSSVIRQWPLYLYPCQSMNDYGAMPSKIPRSGKVVFDPTCSEQDAKIWLLLSLVAQVQDVWMVIADLDEYRTSMWHGWLLMYLAKHCFSHLKPLNLERRDNAFAANKIKSHDEFMKVWLPIMPSPDWKINTLLSNFHQIETISCTDLPDFESIEAAFSECNIHADHTIVLVEDYYETPLHRHPETLTWDGAHIFELRFVARSWFKKDRILTESFMRHGNHYNELHGKWWHQLRRQIPIQYPSSGYVLKLEENVPYLLCYVKIKVKDIKSLGNEMMRYLGGQSHFQCRQHHLPLIISTRRKAKCTNTDCERKEHYCCPFAGCSVHVCKKCVTDSDVNIITYSDSAGSIENEGDVSSTRRFIDETLEGHHRPPASEDEEEETMLRRRDGGHNSDTETDIDDLHGMDIDDFDDFLTANPGADINDGIDVSHNDHSLDAETGTPIIPTTNAGEMPYDIEASNFRTGRFGNYNISGHVLLNQCGTLLTRKRHQIKGSSKHHNLLQKICATNIGSCIPLLQPEAMLFPSIFYKMVPRESVILGAMPSPFLTESLPKYGFQSLPAHVRTRLLSPSSTTSTVPWYIAFSYDMLSNLCATHLDVRVALNRGLTAADDTCGGLGVRGGNDSSGGGLLGSIDSSQMVKNLCASEQYHPKDFFVTITCNQLKHFGTKYVKEWIDSDSWSHKVPNYKNMTAFEKKEFSVAMAQAASGLLLRNWQEVCQLLIDFIRYSPRSPFGRVGSIFSRNEYQKEKGNLSHIHLILQVDWNALTNEEAAFVDDLVRADVFSIVRTQDVQQYVDEGLFSSVEDAEEVYKNAATFLGHKCNERCQRMVEPGVYKCRKDNYAKMSPDTTSHVNIPIPCKVDATCLERLKQIGLAIQEDAHENGYVPPPKFLHALFNPSKHIPPINAEKDENISPVESRMFITCRSMQNVQKITGTGGCNKYVCKYIAKIDEQNYVIVSVNEGANGKLTTKTQFLHNTKVTGTAINEEKVKNASRESSRPAGRVISLMEMLHVMLKYPEVLTDLNFVNVPTVPLELRARIGINAQKIPSDGEFTHPEISETRKELIIAQDYRLLSEIEILLLNDLRLSQYSVDRITQFSLRPPELRAVFNTVGNYYRWFTIEENKKITGDDLEKAISNDLYKTTFIDGFQHIVKVRVKAFPEIKKHLEKLRLSTVITPDMEHVIKLFDRMIDVDRSATHGNTMDDTERDFLSHCQSNVFDNEWKGHLPVPVYSYTRPTSGHKFIMHILLSMGEFSTEAELMMHSSLRECLRAANLIGPLNDDASLRQYSDKLLKRFIEEQLCYFSNSQRVLNDWISLTGDIFDSIIVDDEMLITDMPSVQLTSVLRSPDEAHEANLKQKMENIIDSALKELGTFAAETLPTKEQLMSATKANPHVWDPIASFRKSPSQSEASYLEQKLAIHTAVEAINKYKDLTQSQKVSKNIGIRGFPGGGKSWCCLYAVIYAMSCGLQCLTTAMMAKRASMLGGLHWHKFFGLPSDAKLSPQRMAELAVNKLERNATALNAILTLDFIFADELGQLSSEFVSAINIILCRLRKNNSLFGGVLLIGSLDHTQIQPWKGRPFLSSPLLIPTFSMVKLSQSVRTNVEESYELQKIARTDYAEIMRSKDGPNCLVARFRELASRNFTFVNSWDDEKISSSTFRVYSKKVPVAQAAKDFVTKVRSEYRDKPAELIEVCAVDSFKMNGALSAFVAATQEITKKISENVKPAERLCFFKGAIFECTANDLRHNRYMTSDPVLLYDLPNQDVLSRWRKIKVLKCPPGCKEFIFDITQPKQHFLDLGFVEIEIPIAPEYNIALPSMQCIRKQYCLRHRITGTIHSAMGDTYESMASSISNTDPNFSLWDRGQLVVIISRTKCPKKTIFVGNQFETLDALCDILVKKTQWTDYISKILNIITINEERTTERVLTPEHFPFRIADMRLPEVDTGIVYMLNSLRRRSFIYIGKTNQPRRRLNNHNSGYGSSSTEPAHLKPFAIMAYITGFDGNNELMLACEEKWKLVRNRLMRNGNFDPRAWARGGEEIISNANLQRTYDTTNYDLRLVLLFRDD